MEMMLCEKPPYHISMADTIPGFGLRVKEKRQALEPVPTQEDFGKKVGVGQGQVGNIEKGGSLPSLLVFLKMVRELNTNADYLLGLTDDDKPATDLDDQIVVGVADERSRRVMQQIVNFLAAQPWEEQAFALDTLQRLLRPKTVTEALEQNARLIKEIEKEAKGDPAIMRLLSRFRHATVGGGGIDSPGGAIPPDSAQTQGR